jgi:hypothetical protein
MTVLYVHMISYDGGVLSLAFDEHRNSQPHSIQPTLHAALRPCGAVRSDWLVIDRQTYILLTVSSLDKRKFSGVSFVVRNVQSCLSGVVPLSYSTYVPTSVRTFFSKSVVPFFVFVFPCQYLSTDIYCMYHVVYIQ